MLTEGDRHSVGHHRLVAMVSETTSNKHMQTDRSCTYPFGMLFLFV